METTLRNRSYLRMYMAIGLFSILVTESQMGGAQEDAESTADAETKTGSGDNLDTPDDGSGGEAGAPESTSEPAAEGDGDAETSSGDGDMTAEGDVAGDDGDDGDADAASVGEAEVNGDAPEDEFADVEEDFGDDFFAEEETPVGIGGLTYQLGGHLRGDVWVGKAVGMSRAEIKSAYGEAALRLLVRKGTYGDAVGELRVMSGYENDALDTRLKLREAYVNAYAGPLDIRFGHQIIVWGRADGINPTNNLTPIDLRVRSPEEDDRRVGNLALRLTLNASVIRIEGVWVPLYIPNEFPNLDIPADVRLDAPFYPKPDLANGTEAVRFHLILPAVEMSVSYLYGYSLFPGLVLNDTTYDAAGNDIRHLSRKAWQQHVAGFDFSTAVGDLFGLRGEIAYRHPVDYDIPGNVNVPNPDLYYIAGADREFGDVHISAQYMGRYVFDWEPVDQATQELRFRNRLIHFQKEKVQHGLFLRLQWNTLHEKLSLTASGVMNFTTLEWLVYPKLAYRITDAMTVSVGAEVYQGPDDTLFALVEDVLTAGYTELKIDF